MTLPNVSRADYEAMYAIARKPEHKLLLRLLWHMGNRISEICGDQVHKPPFAGLHAYDLIKVQGKYFLRVQRLKRRKEIFEEVPIPFDLGLAIESYIAFRELKPSDKLLPFGRRYAYEIVRRLGKEALGIKVYPHMFRHGFVYDKVAKGLHPFQIAKLVGHANLNTTMIYYHPTEDEMRKARE